MNRLHTPLAKASPLAIVCTNMWSPKLRSRSQELTKLAATTMTHAEQAATPPASTCAARRFRAFAVASGIHPREVLGLQRKLQT